MSCNMLCTFPLNTRIRDFHQTKKQEKRNTIIIRVCQDTLVVTGTYGMPHFPDLKN